VPSKAIIRTSRLYAEMRSAENFGAAGAVDIRVDFPGMMERMRRIRARVSRHDSARRLSSVGIDLFFGMAHFKGPDAVVVDGQTLRFKKALIATGARPMVPSIPGLVEAGYLTNENVFDLVELPRRMMIIGGGPLGCELAQAFCRFGSHTIIAHQAPFFLPKEERDAAQLVSDSFARDGIEIHLNTTAVKVRVEGKQKLVDLVLWKRFLPAIGKFPTVSPDVKLHDVPMRGEFDSVVVRPFVKLVEFRGAEVGVAVVERRDVPLSHLVLHVQPRIAAKRLRYILEVGAWGARLVPEATAEWRARV
jgi:pyruvate/2-oxoglutarate dehydrogenase complex dihydrolipoamide dehydrogenase (E3) component